MVRLHQNICRPEFSKERDDRYKEELTDGITFSQLILQGDTLALDGSDERMKEDRTILYLFPSSP